MWSQLYSAGDEEENELQQFGSNRSLWKSVERAFGMGYSLVLNTVEGRSRRLHGLTESLSKIFGTTVNANLYYTPGPPEGSLVNQGFEIHWDEMDSVIIQLQGTKQWEVWEPLVEWPLAHQRIKPNRRELTPLMEVTMRPCDVLYLPRGYIHAAHTVATGGDGNSTGGLDDSLHVTIGIFNHLLSYSHAFIDIIQGFTANVHQEYSMNGNGGDVPSLIVSIDHFLGTSTFPQEPLISCSELMLAMAAAYANGTQTSRSGYDDVGSRRTMYTAPMMMEVLDAGEMEVAETLRAEMKQFIRWATVDTAAALAESLRYVYNNQDSTRNEAIGRYHAGQLDPLLKSSTPGGPLLEWARRLNLHVGGRSAIRKLAKPLKQNFLELQAAIGEGTDPDLILSALHMRRHRQHANISGRATALLAALEFHTDDDMASGEL